MCNCGPKGEDIIMTDGNRLDVFFVHPSRGKRMVHGSKTREKLGYIEKMAAGQIKYRI